MIKSIISLINTFNKKVRDDYISAFSAQAAFFIIISFFPFLMFLLTLLQYLPVSETSFLLNITKIFPESINSLIVTIVREIYDKASTTVISITVITALWSASRGFLAIVKGLNSVYRINETRNYFVLRFLSTLYTLVFTIVILISLGILVFGNRIYLWIESRIPFLSKMALVIISLRTIVGLGFLILFFLAMYTFIPNRKTKIIHELPGAILTAAGWLLFSYAYSYYIDNMGNFSYMYGSLTAIVLCMLWVYFCMYIMFIGAEFNVMLRRKEMSKDLNNIKNEFISKKN